MKRFKDRFLSFALALLMTLTMFPAVMMPATEVKAAPDQVTQDANGGAAADTDAFGIKLDTSMTAAESNLKNNPYGTEGWFPLLTINELFISRGHEDTLYTTVYDYGSSIGAVTGGTKLHDSSFTNKDGYTIVATAPCDPYGDGQDKYIAVLAYDKGTNKIEFYLADKNMTSISSILYFGDEDTLGHLSEVRGYEANGFLSVTAGDYEGTGKDNIVIYLPFMRGDQPRIQEYVFKNNKLVLRRHVFGNVFTTLGVQDLTKESSTKSNARRNTPLIQLTTADTDKDGRDELVVTASMSKVKPSGFGTRSSQMFIFDKDNSNDWHQSHHLNTQGYDGAEGAKRLRYSTSSVGNVISVTSGADFPEIVTSGWIDNTAGGGSESIKHSYGSYITECTGMERLADGTLRGTYESTVIKAVNASGFMKGGHYTDDDVQGLVPVVVFPADGIGKNESILIADTVYSYNHAAGGEFADEPYRDDYFEQADLGIGSHVITNSLVVDATAGNFDGNKEGRQQLVFSTLQKRRDWNQYHLNIYTYQKSGDSWKTDSSGYYSDMSGKSDPYVSLTAFDCDSDSTIAKIKSVRKDYTKPEVLALLEAPPYFGELDGGDFGGSETTYGKSEATGESTTTSNGISANIVVGYEYESPGGFGGGVEVNIETEWTWETTNSTTIAYELNYSNDSGENTVVVYRQPLLIYEYELKGSSEKYVLLKPGTIASSMITVDDYNEIVAMSPDYKLDPIADSVLAEPGDPFSYRSSVGGLEDCLESKSWANFSGTGTMGQSITVTQEDEEKSTFELGVGVNAYALLAGFKVGGGVGYSHGKESATINTSEISKSGAVTCKKYDGYDFQWKFVQWTRVVNGTKIPVLGYVVQGASAPPTPPTNLTADKITETSARLNWDHSKRPADEYWIYQYFPAQDISILVATVDATETSCDIKNLEAGGTYYYVIRSYQRASSLGPAEESVDSESIAFTTIPRGAKAITIAGPDDVRVEIGGQAIFKVTVGLPSGYSTSSYQWQTKEGASSWENIGGNSSSLKLNAVSQEMDGRMYRCRVQTLYNGSLLTYYSTSATLRVGQALLDAELTVTNASGGSGSLVNPYTGLSDTLVEDGFTTEERTTSQVKTIAAGEGHGELEVYATIKWTTMDIGMGVIIPWPEPIAPYYGYDTTGDKYYELTESGSSYTVGSEVVRTDALTYLGIDGATSVTPLASFDSSSSVSQDLDGKTYDLRAVASGAGYQAPADDTRLKTLDSLTYYWLSDGIFYEYEDTGNNVGAEADDQAAISASNPYSVYVKDETLGTVLGRAETWTDAEDAQREGYWFYNAVPEAAPEGFSVTPFTETVTTTYSVDGFSPSKLIAVTEEVTETVEIPKYKTLEGQSITLGAKITKDGSPRSGVPVEFRIVNTRTGATTIVTAPKTDVSGKASASWRAPGYGLYSIRAVTSGGGYAEAQSTPLYYEAFGAENTVEYRLELRKDGALQIGSIPYDGKAINLQLMQREVSGTIGNWVAYQGSESITFRVQPMGEGTTTISQTYVPKTGSYTFYAYAGAGTASPLATASLSVTRVPVTVTPVWEAGTIPSSAAQMRIEADPELAGLDDQHLKSIFNINCDYFSQQSPGRYSVALTYKTIEDPSYDKEAIEAFQANYLATLNSVFLDVKSDFATILFSAGENGELVGRYGDTQTEMWSGMTRSSGTKLTFTANPDPGYEVDKWIINGTGYQVTGGALTAAPNWTEISSSGKVLTIESLDASSGSEQLKGRELEIIASFRSTTNTITFAVEGSHGSLSALLNDDTDPKVINSGTAVASGASVTFTAVPDDGYVVKEWKVNGISHKWPAGADYRGRALLVENITSPTTVTVSFTPQDVSGLTVTTSIVNEDGTSSPVLGDITVANAETGASIEDLEGLPLNSSLTFTANLYFPNYTVKEWQIKEGDGDFTTVTGSGGKRTYTLYNMKADTEVRAVVTTAQSYSLTYSVMLDGKKVENEVIAKLVASSSGTELTSGGMYGAYIPIDFTLTLASEYRVVSWEGIDADDGALEASIASLEANTNILVTIAEKPKVTFRGNSNIGISAKQGATELSNGGHVEYGSGDIVFTAQPKHGFETDEWTVTVGNSTTKPVPTVLPGSDDTTYTVSGLITSDVTVEVTAKAIDLYDLTLSAEKIDAEGAHGTVSAEISRKGMEAYHEKDGEPDASDVYRSFYRDSDLTFTAEPHEGYRVQSWTVAGVIQENTSNTLILENVSGDREVSVRFIRKVSGITFEPTDPANIPGYINYAVTNNIDVLADAETGVSLAQGVELELRAIENPGYEIQYWTNNGDEIPGTKGLTTFIYTSLGSDNSVHLKAQFQGVEYPVTYRVSPAADGDISTDLVDGKARGGTEVTFTVTPKDGFLVKNWTVNGAVVDGETGNTFTWEVPHGMAATPQVSAYEVVANIVAGSFSVSYDQPANGALTAPVATGDTVPGGTEVTFTATPDEHYKVQEWEIIGSSFTDSDFTAHERTASITGDTRVSVVFQLMYYNVTLEEATGGSATASSVGAVEAKSRVTFRASPEMGYELAGWLVNGASTASTALNELELEILADTTVTPVFDLIDTTYEVSLIASTGGSAAFEGSAEQTIRVSPNGSVTVTATADEYYMFKEWIVTNGPEDGRVSTVYLGVPLTIDGIRSDTEIKPVFTKAVNYNVSFKNTTPSSGPAVDVIITADGQLIYPGPDAGTAYAAVGNSTIVFAMPAQDESTPSSAMVARWTVNGVLVTDSNIADLGLEMAEGPLSGTLTIPSLSKAMHVEVEFVAYLGFDIPVSGANYTIEVLSRTPADTNPDTQIRENGTVSFKVVPDAGYYIETLTINGKDCLDTIENTGEANLVSVVDNMDGSYTITIENVTSDIDAEIIAELKTFKVTVNNPVNGTLEVTYKDGTETKTIGYDIPIDLPEGTVLTVTATANAGYHLISLEVNDTIVSSGSTITLTADTSIAAFCDAFFDVPSRPVKYWAYDYIGNLYSQGIIRGYSSSGLFKPDDPLTRNHAAKIIARAAGLDYEGKVASFPDVDPESEYSPYIAALAEKGAVTGFPTDGRFKGLKNVKRGHVAKMLVLAFDLKEGPIEAEFSDLPDDPVMVEYIMILASNGIISGYGNTGEFRPDEELTRAQISKIAVLSQAVAAVQKAETERTVETVSLAQARVSALPDDQDLETKQALQARIDAIIIP